MDQKLILFTIVGMAAATFVPRLLPLLLLVNRSLPKPIRDWLAYIPAAVLAAMLLPALLTHDQAIRLEIENLALWASLPTAWVAWKTRSLFAAVVTGMVLVAAGRYLLGW
jgi:branched-subunit amino acid transport protein